MATAGLTPLRATHLGGIQFIAGGIVAAVMFPLSPPTEAIGGVGWVLASMLLVTSMVIGFAMVRMQDVKPKHHLVAVLVGVLMVSTITWLAGGADSPYPTFLVFSAVHPPVHPPRRFAALLALLCVAVVAPLLYSDADHLSVALSLARLAAIIGVAAGVAYLIGTVYDDDARLRSEAEAAKAEAGRQAALAARLEELDRLKDSFVSAVSHELRTPLTSIKGYTEALITEEAGELNDEQREYGDIVYRNAARLEELIGDLLLLSRIESGALTLAHEHFDLAAVASSVTAGQRLEAIKKGLELELDASGHVEVVGDRRRIEQALGNLITNAIKYSREGTISVRVGDSEGEATVEVSDMGIGIPADEIARVGERFFRASTVTSEQGSGLGLAISREIMELHEGHLDARSEVGVGSTFSMRLPLATASASSDGAQVGGAQQPE